MKIVVNTAKVALSLSRSKWLNLILQNAEKQNRADVSYLGTNHFKVRFEIFLLFMDAKLVYTLV